MAAGVRPRASFRISPVDRLGRSISPLVLDAAEKIGRRAIRHAENLLIDPAVATTLMEEAAAAVSRAVDRKKHCDEQPVRDLRAYLFRAFLRRLNKAKKRQLMVAAAVRLFSATSPRSTCPWRINTVESSQRNVTLLHRREATIRQGHQLLSVDG